ncbi:MAG: deoxyribodipyrimidine photo-lyase [Glaciecola sp.]|jgi:deoxyribodipyrimidine photo-lyase
MDAAEPCLRHMHTESINPRIRSLNAYEVNSRGRFVLYWMTANRRSVWNHALDRALEWSRELGKPLLVLEALRVDYPWASERMHRFVLQGMRDNLDAFGKAGVRYYPYVERQVGEGRGLLKSMAEEACVVIADDWPHGFAPRMLSSATEQVSVPMEAVDSVGLWPVRGLGIPFSKPFSRAYDFRRFLQKELEPALHHGPKASPLKGYEAPSKARISRLIQERWPECTSAWLRAEDSLAALPLDHSVQAVDLRGGPKNGQRLLTSFVARGLPKYNEKRTDLDCQGTSGLSPFLHFGHVSTHQILHAAAKSEGWKLSMLDATTQQRKGGRLGWWQMGAAVETFLDQVVTWRELGFHRSALDSKFGSFEGLPAWALTSLQEHSADPRPYLYSHQQFEAAETHDELWNAAQNQLRREGILHNYMRMLWGKKILHWSRSPKAAYTTMVELNNKYALDGRDPNSDSGIGWVCGLFDRAWGPERPVFGKIRYMSSANTRRKLRVNAYVARHNQEPTQGRLF